MMSSSKKNLLIQCRHCNCFCLVKDVDVHDGILPNTSTSSSINSATPKHNKHINAIQERRRKTTNKKSTQMVEMKNEKQNCDGSEGFLQSQLPLVEPGKGLALREDNSLDDAEKWDRCFPMELRGWQKRHSGLIHPTMLNLVGALPRSAFLMERFEEETERRAELITLWPCSEIPILCIAVPHSMRTNESSSKSKPRLLIRLRLIHSFGQPLTKLLLRPNVSATALPTLCWTKLAKLQHFHYFLRSYFSSALLSINRPVEVFYYMMRLEFDIANFECLQPIMEIGLTNGNLAEKMENCSLNGVEEKANSNLSEMPNFHRISLFCKFSIDWSQITEEKPKDDDSESLL